MVWLATLDFAGAFPGIGYLQTLTTAKRQKYRFCSNQILTDKRRPAQQRIKKSHYSIMPSYIEAHINARKKENTDSSN